jgi:hypothetical protein
MTGGTGRAWRGEQPVSEVDQQLAALDTLSATNFDNRLPAFLIPLPVASKDLD